MSDPITAAGRPTGMTAAPDVFMGEGLVLLMGAFRSGTTLLRKILDTHPAIHSPAETWFLLPLLDLWSGSGETAAFNRRQAAVGLQSHLERADFVRCCRAFAGEFYRTSWPERAELFVDKTPLYLSIAGELVECFPEARLIVLARDPRAILWSRATWRHAATSDPAAYVSSVAADMRELAAIFEHERERACLVQYEALCRTPEQTIRDLCEFLGVEFEPAMLQYGSRPHHEGYGDERTLEHRSPHDASVDRWREGLPAAVEDDLLAACDGPVADTLELNLVRRPRTARPVSVATPPPAAQPHSDATPPSLAGRRVLFFVHEGTNSRDILLDFSRGFRKAGAEVIHWELAPIDEMRRQRGGAEAEAEALTDASRIVRGIIQANGIDLSMGLWAYGLLSVAHGRRNGQFESFFDGIESPHVLFWLDAPHWAHQGAFREHFRTPVIQSDWCFNVINNGATALEMAAVLGFRNVLPLPYGIDEERFRPHEVPKTFDLVFGIGPGDPEPTALMRRELESDDPDVEAIRRDVARTVRAELDQDTRFRAALVPLVDSQLADPHRPMLDRIREIAAGGAAERAACERLLLDIPAYLGAGETIRRIEGWRRPFVISHLSRHFRCAVFGEGSLTSWDARVESMGYVAHVEQARLYSRGRVGLNVMRWQDDVGLNLKPFEIAASGVPCLCERRGEVETMFDPDSEIVLFETPGEARRRLADLLERPEHLEAIGAAARARVHRDHTWRARAARLAATIGEATGRW